MLKQLLSLVQDAHARSGRALRRAVGRGQRAQLQALLTGKEWTSADGMHVIYHMLTALPWPARAASDTLLQAMTLSAWLGALVDAAAFQRRHRGRVADHVIMWASRWIKALARTR